jgi:hypothetical protein
VDSGQWTVDLAVRQHIDLFPSLVETNLLKKPQTTNPARITDHCSLITVHCL